jgi:hypothetical protein
VSHEPVPSTSAVAGCRKPLAMHLAQQPSGAGTGGVEIMWRTVEGTSDRIAARCGRTRGPAASRIVPRRLDGEPQRLRLIALRIISAKRFPVQNVSVRSL